MSPQFDMNLLPLYRINGQEWPSLPGLLTFTPPKKVARGRDGDHLIVFLTLSGNVPFSSADYSRLTSQLAERFYKTPGSLTSALRATAENLNQFLLDRNLRSTGRGQYLIGRLLLGVLRGSQLVLIQSGPTHVFQVGQAARHLHDAQISGRGLGLSQSTPIYFIQLDLNPGDLLVFCPQLPAGWEASLLSERGKTSLETMYRKLMGINREDICAVLLQVRQGNGRMTVLRVAKAEQPARSAATQAGAAQARPSASPAQERKTGPVPQVTAEQPSQPSAGKEAPAGIVSSRSVELPSERRARSDGSQPLPAAQLAGGEPRQGAGIDRVDSGALPAVGKDTHPRRDQVLRGLAKFIGRGRQLQQSFLARLRQYLPNLLPAGEGQEPALPGSVMAVVAIIIPLIVVTIATVVYMRFGRIAQYEENYQLALEMAVGAIGSDDPAIVRHAWESTLFYLDKADVYQGTEQSRALREEAQSALDGMDGIIRLDFRLAIVGGLSKTVQVSHMVATDTDLYILNSTNGSVIRAFLTNQGYAVDSEFKCGPGAYEGYQVGPLLDIASLPPDNTRSATLLGMDAGGTLLYCTPEADPQAVPLTPPDTHFKGLVGFTLDASGKNLYLLDPAANAIWAYVRKDGEYGDLPILFFNENAPAGMPDALDVVATADDLYLLYRDGHMTLCSLSQIAEVPLRCYDPAPLQDNRPGHQSGSVITDAVFTQMSFAAPPDPSLYLLVPKTHALYRFSPRPDSLNLQGQFRAMVEQAERFSTPATAMAISLNRYLFLSIGNQIYYATDVP